jgi:hypothetical protein
MSHELHNFFTVLTFGFIGLVTSVTLKTLGSWTGFTFKDFGIGVSQLDSDISNFLISETDSLHPGNSFHDSRFTVGNMTDSTDVLGCLTRNDFKR